MKNLKFIFLLLLFSCISLETSDMSQNTEKAYFAGGCFWCMEPPFEALDGVIEATSGYMGGDENKICLISAKQKEDWPLMSKKSVARKLAAKICDALEL